MRLGFLWVGRGDYGGCCEGDIALYVSTMDGCGFVDFSISSCCKG